MTEPTELRPPPEHEDKVWHWVCLRGGEPIPVQWRRGHLYYAERGGSLVSGTADACRYLGPAEWVEPPRFPADPGRWEPHSTVERLSLPERARLVTIAHESSLPEIRKAALLVLEAAAMVDEVPTP